MKQNREEGLFTSTQPLWICYLERFNNLYVNTNTLILHNLALKYVSLSDRNQLFSVWGQPSMGITLWAPWQGTNGRPQAASAHFPAPLMLQEHMAHSPITLAIKQWPTWKGRQKHLCLFGWAYFWGKGPQLLTDSQVLGAIKGDCQEKVAQFN